MEKIAGAMPLMGLGTYGRRGAEGQAAMETALEVGYRLLDTAQDYNTEEPCGAAFRASGLAREEVFFTTKVATGNLGAGKVVPSVHKSLETLGLDKLDLVLIHWPAPNGEIPLSVYVEQLAEVLDSGLTTHIGVSNFTIALIDEALDILGGRPLLTNQVEVHPYLQNVKLAEHCKAKGVSITCYMPIAKGRIGADPVMQEIAQAHGATPEQVSLAFLMQQDMAVIPSSANEGRMRQNFAATELTLTGEEMDRVRTLDRGMRLVDPEWGPDWD